MDIKNAPHPSQTGTKGKTSVVPPSFADTARALVFPLTEDDPSAHFLAAAPERTPHHDPGRLSAGDRPSLGAVFPLWNFSLMAFISDYLLFITHPLQRCKGEFWQKSHKKGENFHFVFGFAGKRRPAAPPPGRRCHYRSLSFTNYCHKFEMDIYDKLC